MNPITVITAVNAGLSLVESLLPLLDQFKLSGEITSAQQADVLNRYQSLRNRADGQFGGPEWTVTVDSGSTPVK